MKKNILIALLILSSVNFVFSQIPQPDFNNKPYYLKSDSTLNDLETVDAAMDYKFIGMGYGGVEYYFTAFNETSTKSFTTSEIPTFVIKVDDGIDPSDFLTLIKAKVKKKKRLFVQGNMSATGKARDVSENVVSLEYKKISDNYYKIILGKDLIAGEYAFIRVLNTENQAGVKVKIYCFTVK